MNGIFSFFGNNVNGNNVNNASDATPATDVRPASAGTTDGGNGGNGTTPTGNGVHFSLDAYRGKAVRNARKYYKGSAFSPFRFADMSSSGKDRKKSLKDWTDKTTSLNGVGRLLFVFTRGKDNDDDGLKSSLVGTYAWDVLKRHTAKEEFKNAWFNFVTTSLHPSLLHANDDGTTSPVEYVQETFPVVTGKTADGDDITTEYPVFTTTPDGDVIPSYVPRVIVRFTVVKAVQLVLDDDERRKKTGDTRLVTDGQRFYFTPDGARHDIPTDAPTPDTPATDDDDTPHDPVTGDDIPTDTPTPDTADTPDVIQ